MLHSADWKLKLKALDFDLQWIY